MAKATPKLRAKKPVSTLQKPLKADLKQLLTALAKGIGHTTVGKWEELGTDSAEALSALGLTTEPGELAFLLPELALSRLLDEYRDAERRQLRGCSSSGTTAASLLDGGFCAQPQGPPRGGRAPVGEGARRRHEHRDDDRPGGRTLHDRAGLRRRTRRVVGRGTRGRGGGPDRGRLANAMPRPQNVVHH